MSKYLTIRKLNGISERWLYDVRDTLEKYLDFISWVPEEDNTLEYLALLQDHYSTTAYRKKAYQIRKFLAYLNIEWAKNINPPAEPSYTPKRVTLDDIRNTLAYFKEYQFEKQTRAIIFLGATSGLRAEELYQLTKEDIDLNRRIINVNHDPDNGQTTKTGHSRIAIFNEEAKQMVFDYFKFFDSYDGLSKLFSITHIERLFRKAPIKVKDLRKFFSQEWDRKGGPTSIKKLLMGHSGDVDLHHYNAQSEEDLLAIYDNVGIQIGIDSLDDELKNRGYKLVNYIEGKTGININLVYAKPNKEDDGRTICNRQLIIVYWNKQDWEWLREVIVHECAHRLDCKYRGSVHHKPQLEHDKNYWRCYKEVMEIAKKSSMW